MELIQNNTYLYVLQNHNLEWRLQSSTLAIEVISGARILVRNRHMAVEDCIGIAEQLGGLQEALGIRRTGTSAPPKVIPLSSAVHNPPKKPLHQAVTSSSSTGGIAGKSLSFPLVYACDMVPGLRKLQGLKDCDKPATFLQYFPECSYKRSTVGGALTMLNRALTADILDTYVEYGHTPRGTWKELIKAVRGAFIS